MRIVRSCPRRTVTADISRDLKNFLLRLLFDQQLTQTIPVIVEVSNFPTYYCKVPCNVVSMKRHHNLSFVINELIGL